MKILGIRVDEVNMQEAEAAVGKLIAAFHNGQGGSQIVTINPEGIWLAKDDPQLQQIVEKAALVTADGSGVLWAAQKLGHPLRHRFCGLLNHNHRPYRWYAPAPLGPFISRAYGLVE